MAIQHVGGRYIVTIRDRRRANPLLMVDTAMNRDDARILENDMIAALRKGVPWPAEQPSKGTLAAVLLDAWGTVGGWYKKQVGALYYAIALDFITFIGAERKAATITVAVIERYLEGRDKTTTRAIFQFLKAASDSGAVSWRTVQRRDGRGQIDFLRERVTRTHKFIQVENPGNGPRWIKIDLPKRPWE